MQPQIDILLKAIEQQLDWGDSASWQSRDFENLQDQILDHTGVSLSASTLRRIWGRVAYNSLPSTTTLDTLARFAGYESWRSFNKQQGTGAVIMPGTTTDAVTTEALPATTGFPAGITPVAGTTSGAVASAAANTASQGTGAKGRYPAKFIWMVAATLVVIFTLVGIFALKKTPPPPKPSDYQFSSKPVTRSIPNSVIFSYDATAAQGDSVEIQQSWDGRRRKRVGKNAHTHTSIYYEPGFYRAKLLVDNQVVKETPLIIPTNGWVGMIQQEPVPVYLPANAFERAGELSLSADEILQQHIALKPQPPVVKFFNVGNFEPVPLADFSFSTTVKHTYRDGAAACQLMAILLITDDAPIIIPLSDKGCVSELNLMSVDEMVSGKSADLSGFGVDFTDWAQVSGKRAGNKIQYTVNGKPAYSCQLPDRPVHIVGIAYNFMGTGAVKDVRLYNKDKQMFKAFP
ncbi:hypothetical protein F0L74_16480 [Chitinophaga agrisoli]|uniref:PKD domain-containing protein n=1 Tax=Chitinophaga agrisoli TaxID=2607653 RepID=A0A5B2VT53_9BACT|nr:hypothetical protein [Chitinophaga agrisoli]KAA2241492.1 hypothetical protein F0L74_16480 [Chitinophaga agrisoli]